MDKLEGLMLGLKEVKILKITKNKEEVENLIKDLEGTLFVNRDSMDIETVLKTL